MRLQAGWLAALALVTASAQTPQRKLLVVSVDGLDQRYLSDAGTLGLRIPNIRRLIGEGQWSQGVVGVVPTVTWPSHTTIITGVTPPVHGIRGNRRPAADGGDYYWDVSLLHARTLLDAVKDAGRTSATITWPVTVGAPSDFNLPEYFVRRRGGDMDTRSVASKAKPADLAARITAMFPSFPQQWMDDRTRTLAVLYLLRTARPDLILAHLVDLDSEAHDMGPFTTEANATLEHIDSLIGEMLNALPPGYAFVLTSDHGFEAVHKEVNVGALAKARGVKGVTGAGGIAFAETPEAAAFLAELKSEGGHGIGRPIPRDEILRFALDLAGKAAVYESAPNVLFSFGSNGAPDHGTPREAGNHGHWPTRYRSVYVAWGRGLKAERLPEFSQTEIAGRLAALLGLQFTPGPNSSPTRE